MDKNVFDFLNVSADKFMELLSGNNYACNADGRRFMAGQVSTKTSRPLPDNINELIHLAVEIGGCKPDYSFPYTDARGKTVLARVCDLYKLPTDMVNPYVLYFSGCLTAPFYAAECIRWYAKQHGILLDSGSTGKEGNKGLFKSVFDREKGIIIGTEYEANFNIAEFLMPKDYVRKHEATFLDTNTVENLKVQYQMALKEHKKEITLVLVTGQPWYDKRLLAEWMWELRKPEYSQVKINLVLAHCPLWLNGSLPEAHPSEIMLGYIAASLGPLKKDCVHLNGLKETEHAERYLMPGILNARWDKIEPIIRNYGNMGWPNYSEILYGTSHEEAVAEIIIADIFARNSFNPVYYDTCAIDDITSYQKKIGICGCSNEKQFIEWCIDSTEEKFFV